MDLAASAGRLLTRIGDALRDAVMEAAPSTELKIWPEGDWLLRLNDAELEFLPLAKTGPDPWGDWQPPAFEVVVYGGLGVTIPTNRYVQSAEAPDACGSPNSLGRCCCLPPSRHH